MRGCDNRLPSGAKCAATRFGSMLRQAAEQSSANVRSAGFIDRHDPTPSSLSVGKCHAVNLRNSERFDPYEPITFQVLVAVFAGGIGEVGD
jgi:hypothetical protein